MDDTCHNPTKLCLDEWHSSIIPSPYIYIYVCKPHYISHFGEFSTEFIERRKGFIERRRRKKKKMKKPWRFITSISDFWASTPPIPLYTHLFHHGEFIVVKTSLEGQGGSHIASFRRRKGRKPPLKPFSSFGHFGSNQTPPKLRWVSNFNNM